MLQRIAVVAVVLLGLVACGDDDGGGSGPQRLPSFEDALNDGASCRDLFDIRNAWDPHSPLVEQANVQLRGIGCYSRNSERTDRP